MTFEEIERLLGVGERQTRRIIRELSAAGPAVLEEREGAHKVFFYAPEQLAGESFTVELSEEEALALAFAAEAARTALEPTHLAEPLAEAARRLFDAAEVLTFEPEDTPTLVRFAGETGAEVDRDVFRRVWDGVRERRSLLVTYVNARGRRSEARRLDPYALVVVRGSWTLVAFDHERLRVAHFSLPAIEHAEVGEPHDGPPDDFDVEQHLRDAFGGFATDGADVETIRLDVSSTAAASFRRKRYHPTQVIEEETQDGSIVVSFEAALAPDLEAFVRSFGPAVRVIEPASLAAAVALAARETAGIYQAGVQD
jgi:predicted DNA-binding transcriptional regulator YafY